jgi:uncharacterized protein YneF (UPF0154 family)
MQTLLRHQRELHNHLKKYYPTIINGGKVALTRGLNTNKPKQEHPLASYGDVQDTGFGEVMHHRRVPLNNIWYTYMLGPKNATSENYGNENEWLVSPHEIEEADSDEVKTAIPREWHDLTKPAPDHIRYLDEKSISKEMISDLIKDDPNNAIKLLFNSPKLDKSHVDELSKASPALASQLLKNHPLFDKSNVDSVVEKSPEYAAEFLKDHPLFGKEHVDWISAVAPRSAAKHLNDHPLLDRNNIKAMIENGGATSVEEFLHSSPLIDKEIMGKIVPQVTKYHLNNLQRNKNFGKEHVDWLANNRPDYLTAINNSLIDKSHLDIMADKIPGQMAVPFKDHPDLNKEHITKILANDPEDAKFIPHEKIDGDHINTVLNSFAGTEIEYLRNHPLITKDHITKSIESAPHHNVSAFESHPLFDKSHMDLAIKLSPETIARQISSSTPLDKDQIDKLIEATPDNFIHRIIGSSAFNKNHLTKLITLVDSSLAHKLARHSLFDKSHMDLVVNSTPAIAAMIGEKHPEKLDKEQIDKIAEKRPDVAPVYLKDHPLIDRKTLDILVNKEPKITGSFLGNHPQLTKEHINHIVSSNPESAAQSYSLTNNPLFDKSHIDKIVDAAPAVSAMELRNHPLFDKSHIDKLVAKSPGNASVYLKDHPLLKKDNLKKSIGIPEESISTKRTHNGMFFHTFRIGDAYHHILSHSEDPYSQDDAVAASHVQKNGDDASLKWTLCDSKHKGKGYATQAYLETLNHHKSLTNDDTPEDLDKSTDRSHKVAILSD